MNRWDLIKWAYTFPIEGRSNRVDAKRRILLYLATHGRLEGNRLRCHVESRKYLAKVTELHERRCYRAVNDLIMGGVLERSWTRWQLTVEQEHIRALRKQVSERMPTLMSGLQ